MLLVIVIFVYIDLYVLYLQDRRLFKDTFTFSSVVYFFCVLAGFLLLMSGFNKQVVSCIAGFSFPIYLIRRYQFRKTLKSSGLIMPDGNENLSLASDAFGILLLWFGGMVIFSVILKGFLALAPQMESQLGELVILSTFSSVFILILIIKTIGKYPDITFLQAVGLKRDNRSTFKTIVLPIILGLVFALIASRVLLSRAQQPMTPLDEIVGTTTSSWVFLAFIATAVLVAPFFEEIVFRGYFFYILNRIKGKAFAVIVVAGVFGLLHVDQYWGDWEAIAWVGLLGFLLTFLRAWTGTSIASIATHYAYNAGMTILPVIFLVLTNPSFYQYQMDYEHLSVPEKEELLQKSIAAQPDHAISCNDLAWLYAEEGKNLDEALVLVDRALSVDSEHYAFLDTKAEVLYRMGHYEEAIAIEEGLQQRYPADEYVQRQLEKFRLARQREGPEGQLLK